MITQVDPGVEVFNNSVEEHLEEEAVVVLREVQDVDEGRDEEADEGVQGAAPT